MIYPIEAISPDEGRAIAAEQRRELLLEQAADEDWTQEEIDEAFAREAAYDQEEYE